MSTTTTADQARIFAAFEPPMLRQICTLEPHEFADEFDMIHVEVNQQAPHDFYLFKDNGARVLFVAHLDNVDETRRCDIVDTAAGPVVFSPALDDRLGAYVGLELLPRLGLDFDYLLTVGEEMGMSTASFFDPAAHGVEDRYDYIIEFDRGGTDVVLYQYDCDDLRARVRATGARVEEGIFSDISSLEHVGIKALNWGVGYRDYHGPRSHAWLADTFKMVEHYLIFDAANRGTTLTHEYVPTPYRALGGYSWSAAYNWSSDDYGDLATEDCSEWADQPDECSGSVYDTRYGLLCDGHRRLYFES